MTVCKSAVVLHCINLQFCYVIFSVISMAFDRCSINDYLLTYELKINADHRMQLRKKGEKQQR